MQREEAIEILGLDAAQARDFSKVRIAYHRRIRAVHPDLNPHPDASAATATVSAAYDLLYKAHRAARTAEERRRTADRPKTSSSRSKAQGPTSRSRARVLNDATLTVTGSPAEVFSLTLAAARRIGEVSHAESDDGLIALVAEFLHAPPCSLSLQVARRGADRSHVRCHVEPLSTGEPPPVAAVTRLVAQTISEIQAKAS